MRRQRRRWRPPQPGRPLRPAAMSSASLAPRHPRRRRKTAALLHRSVENRPASVRSGRWDLIRVDEGPIWGGVWEVVHAVVAHALGRLHHPLPLLLPPPLAPPP